MAVPHKSEAGFTLAEMLISLAILALIASLSASAISFATAATKRVSFDAPVQRALAARDVLERIIGQARPFYALSDGGQVSRSFSGAPERLILVSPTPIPTERPGLFVVEFRIEQTTEEAAGRSLVMRYWPFLPFNRLSEMPDEAPRAVLLEGVEAGGFAYLSLGPDGQWQSLSDWPAEQTALPDMVEVQLAGQGYQHNLFVPLSFSQSDIGG